MKNLKRLLLVMLCLLFTVSSLPATVSAEEQTSKEIPHHIQELIDLDSEGFNEFFEKVDLNSDFAVHGESYIKIFESEQGNTIDKREYTREEYLEEINKVTPYAISQPENWMQIDYSIYPVYGKELEIGVAATFTWLKTPQFFGKDLITISTDTNYVTPGSEDMVNAAYWPNIDCPSIVGSYRNGTSFTHGEFEFDDRGVTFKNNLASDEFRDEILQTTNYTNYFMYESGNWYTKGCPQFSMSTIITRADSTTMTGKILFTYNHQQISINFNPRVNVSDGGEVKVIGAITAGLGFDSASISKNYHYGDQIW